ncbi:MAG: hypothetical protein IJ619_08395 [Eubacterium sp.]|nr:hypothetical protein [Eubacterium sp.]
MSQLYFVTPPKQKRKKVEDTFKAFLIEGAHFTDGEEYPIYEEMAILFANDVNNITHDSFVDKNGSTYKFSYETYEFVIVSKNGVIITYFIPENGEVYWENVRRKHGK